MKRTLLAIGLTTAVVVCGGCSRFALDSRDLAQPISLTREVGMETSPTNVTQFESSTRVGYCGWLLNLVTLKDADLSKMLDKEIKAAGGVAVRNVTVKKEQSFVDGLIAIVSLGFYIPETVTVQGEVLTE